MTTQLPRRPTLLALAALAAAALAPRARAEDWPIFLGPRQNGTSAETGLLLDWPPEGPPRAWAKRLGAAYSPPVAARGRVVAFHRLGDQEVVECLDARSGASLWDFRYPTRYADRYQYNGGPRSSPAIDGDRVYTYGAEGVLTCLEFQTGRLVWQRPLNRDLGAPQEFFGAGVPPVIEGDVLLLNVGAPGGAGVVGLSKHTGDTVWKTSDHGAGYSAPVVATFAGRRLAAVLTKDGLLLMEPAGGRVLHEFPFRSDLRESVNAASPVVVGDVVFLSATYGVGSVALRVGAGGLDVLWRDRRNMENHWATSIYLDGFLYGAHGRHEKEAVLRCLDWRTGEVRWTSPRGLGRATCLLADGHLLALGERGDLALIQARPDACVEKARVRVLEYPCWAPPILADGRLYLRSETILLALDLRRARAPDPAPGPPR